MAQLNRNRSKLLLGCGTAALGVALAAAPQSASAQAIQATENVTNGAATRIFTGTGTETIRVDTDTAVIDWTPDENGAGDALDFLPTNNVVTYRNGPNNSDFAVLNRILPSTNGNIVVFDGTVLSQLFDTGTGGLIGPGGTVAFYSPTGIFIGDNAVFDVGNLILTTLDPDLASFDDFALNGGQLQLIGVDASTDQIIIQPGAQITASAENSYFAVAAAEIRMLGTSDVNGSTAFIGGEIVNLTVSNGLFDIEIPVGSASTVPIVLDGDVGGPSSTGPGDNHLLYAVAAAQNDPISMIFRGNLGFEPAAGAGIVNGEIILSANYNVSGRDVDGGSVDGGINQDFDGNSELTDIAGSIFLEGFNASSTLLAIANEEVQVSSFVANSSVDGDLLLIGRNFAELTSAGGFDFIINGDVLVSARDFGEVGTSFNDPNAINAEGGDAFIDAFDGTMTINGEVIVTADARAGADTGTLLGGTATGGFATIAAGGGSLTINGDSFVTADASQEIADTLLGGGDVTGGIAQVFASNNGLLTTNGSILLSAGAASSSTDTNFNSVGINTFGGLAIIQALTGGNIDINGFAEAYAFAFSGAANNANGGAIADAGAAELQITGDSTIDIEEALILESVALGGRNFGGRGGDAFGGRASAFVQEGGTLNVGDSIFTVGNGRGGDGIGGGDGFGGISGAQALEGSITVVNGVSIDAIGFGGNANIDFGGDGGIGEGGNAFLVADGSADGLGIISIGGDVNGVADGVGGSGGDGDGDNILAGRGGDGIGGNQATPNQADPGFASGGNFLADRDNSTYTVGGNLSLFVQGTGGRGGDGGSDQDGGDGGDGIGGFAQVGQYTSTGTTTIGDSSSTADFADVEIFTNGVGGDGGNGSTTDTIRGNGGIGEGGGSFFTAREGDVTAGTVSLNSDGAGGVGHVGGDGIGGISQATGGAEGTMALASLEAFSVGRGGVGDAQGGIGTGGIADLDFASDGFTFSTTNNLFFDAGGVGGSSFGGVGGEGIGGLAIVEVEDDLSSADIGGDAILISSGTGGESSSALGGGDATGGASRFNVFSAGTINVDGTVELDASAFAGLNNGAGPGGTGTGGAATLDIQNDGTITIGVDFIARATGLGGFGGVGGNGEGGLAAARVGVGTLSITDAFFADATGSGGDANGTIAFGGDGGRGTGGLAAIRAEGTQTETATITIGGDASIFSNGFGGDGGLGNGIAAPGDGGEAFGGNQNDPNVTDSAFNNGAYILAGGDNGSVTIGGNSLVLAQARGGLGGDNSDGPGGTGGFAQGGTAVAGLILFGTDGSVGNGSANFADIGISAFAFAGNGGFGGDSGGPIRGDGGQAFGGEAFYLAQAGTLNGGNLFGSATATGGFGDTGGFARGGDATMDTTLGGTINATGVQLFAFARGGGSINGPGAEAIGGLSFIDVNDGDIFVDGDVELDAGAFGGGSQQGDGGRGQAGRADLAAFNGNIAGTATITGNAAIITNGVGGDAGSGAVGGQGEGGISTIEAHNGSTITIGSAQVTSSGMGGSGPDADGGDGFGGFSFVRSRDPGSSITIQTNTPQSFADDFNRGAIIASNGFGGDGEGGEGLGGNAFGGEIQINTSGNGSIILPQNSVNDPNSQAGNGIQASAFGGGSSVEDGIGGEATGGFIFITLNGGLVDFGQSIIAAFAVGGGSLDSDATVNGGNAIGGERLWDLTNGAVVNAEIVGGSAGASGGDGSNGGNGGNASGGGAFVFIDSSTLNLTGNNLFNDSNFGGNGEVGGSATGPEAVFNIRNSTVTLTPNANGDATWFIGGETFGGGGQSQGGAGTGGDVNVLFRDSSVTGGAINIFSDGSGGTANNASGTGGIGTAGELTFLSDGSILNLVGNNLLSARAFGGAGFIGGDAFGEAADIEFSTSDVNISPDGSGNAGFAFTGNAFGGNGVDQGGNGTASDIPVIVFDSDWQGGDILIESDGIGGSASGSDSQGGIGSSVFANLVVSDNSELNIDTLTISADAFGGAAGSGTGGEALAGEATLEGTSSIINVIGSLDVTTDAFGGSGLIGGRASSGFTTLNIFDVDLFVARDLSGNSIINVSSSADGGIGSTAGDAETDTAQLLVLDSTINADFLDVISNANASGDDGTTTGGIASGGNIEAIIEGTSEISVIEAVFEADAVSTLGGTTFGGISAVDVDVNGTGSGVFTDLFSLSAEANGGDTNTTGRIEARVEGGVIETVNFTGFTTGDTVEPDPIISALIANGGSILVSDTMIVDVFGSIDITTGLGGIIGGPTVSNPTADIRITANPFEGEGTISIFGDDDNLISFGGASMLLESAELDIFDGARIGAIDLTLFSLDTDHPMFLGDGGGTVSFADTIGYELTQAEASRIDATNVTIQQPLVDNDGSDDPDILIGNITAFGSLDDGVSNIFIEALGGTAIVRVEGEVNFVDTDITDTFTISAEGQIEIVTPGGIRVLNPAGDPGGALFLSSNNIWVGDSDLIALLQDDANFAGRNDQLRIAASGSDDPLGYVRARQVSIEFADTFLVRNTGDSVEQGGILVGDGGLSIFGSDNSEGTFDAFAYGARIDSQGNLITGEDFFNEVNFNNDGSTGSITYTDASEFNDCIINTGECPTAGPGPDPDPPVEPPVEPPSEGSEEVSVPLNNPNVIEGPIMTVSPVPAAPAVLDEEFGVDFPTFIAEPNEQDEEEIDDPVSSGGDSSIYGQGNSGSVEVEGN